MSNSYKLTITIKHHNFFMLLINTDNNKIIYRISSGTLKYKKSQRKINDILEYFFYDINNFWFKNLNNKQSFMVICEINDFKNKFDFDVFKYLDNLIKKNIKKFTYNVKNYAFNGTPKRHIRRILFMYYFILYIIY